MTEKQKSIRFNATVKTKDVDGERRIVFVASSGSVDRDYERVDVPSLRLPLKAGGEIQVSQIGSEGVEGVDIPLMLNHSGDIRDVIGSVRKAWFENGELIFEAGISSRGIAQEILTLIDEGHLSNAFSITMIDFDFDYDTETIRNAEVIEVSVVYRGSNKDARLLAVKSLLGGEQMEEAEKVEAPIEAETVETVEEPVGEAPVEQVEESANEAEAETEKEEAEAEEPVDETATEQEQPAEPTAQEEPKEKEQEMEKEIAQDAVVAKATPVQTAKSESNYLASKKALADFKNIVLSHHRGDNASIMKAWMSHISSKAISGDAVLPTRIEQIFFKTWTDKAEILNTFRTLGVRAGAVYAMKATSNGTALAHEKGATKLNQEIEAVRRDLKGLGIYKKLPIDLQDLFDDETGELLAFRVEELAGRVAHAIVVGAIVGGYKDANGRGLFSMKGDLDGASASPADDFGSAVATVIPNSNTDSDLAKAIKTTGAVKGDRRILIVPAGWTTNARIALIGMNYPVADLAEFVGADEIHELDEMTGSGYDMIAYARDSYVLAGEANASVRTDFDLDKNQDVMLVERYVGGSITGYKNLAGYASA